MLLPITSFVVCLRAHIYVPFVVGAVMFNKALHLSILHHILVLWFLGDDIGCMSWFQSINLFQVIGNC